MKGSISTEEIQFNHKPAKRLLTENKKGVSQNGQTPSIIGICSYCVLDRPVFERCQTLLHPGLTPLSRWCPPQETSQPHLPKELLCRQGGKSWKDEQTNGGRTKYKLQPTHQFQGFRHDKDFVSWCPSSQQVNDQWLCMTTFDVMWLNHKMKIVYHRKQSDKTLNQTGRTRFRTDLIKRKCRRN